MATVRKTPKADAPTSAYVVLSPLEHDQEPYAVGDPIELTDDQAKPLADVKAIAPAAKVG